MFYIEKCDKPNWLERKLNLIKMQENTIILPIDKNTNEKQIEKMAKKTNKIIQKYSTSKKVVLSKEMYKEQKYINYLNTYGLLIQDGKWLFEILLPEITEYIIKKKKIENAKISIMINDLTDVEIENIKILSKKYKTINIVTNHIEKFKKIEKQLQENEGIIITITNNKKKSLIKSQIILNIDFPEEILNKYNIQDEATIINVRGNVKINKKRFNGLNINNYEIDFRDDKKDNKTLNKKFYLKDLYEAEIYKKQRVSDIKKKILEDKVTISNIFL